MLLRAWKRALSLLLRKPADLAKANLAASGAMLLVAALWAAAAAAHLGAGPRAALRAFSAWTAWCCFSFLCFQARRALEAGQAPLGRGLKDFIRLRLAWASLSFIVAGLAAFWIGLAVSFYRAESVLLLAVTAVFALVMAAATLCHFGLASKEKAQWRQEWQAAWLMAGAFFPHCLACLLGLALLSGAGSLALGFKGLWARLLWLPALFLPLLSASFMAAVCVALVDEFLARSLGIPPPEADLPDFTDLTRPWS